MKITLFLVLLTILISCFSQIYGQKVYTRSYVSAVSGIDSQSCGSITSPCRTFSGGIARTLDNGEVIAVDSGMYDTANQYITAPITLSAAPGVHAELGENTAGYQIELNLTSGGDVTLRNLIFRTRNSASGDAILVRSIGTLTIENCTIDGYGAGGVDVEIASSARVTISNTVIRNGGVGAYFATTSGTLKVAIDHCRFENFTGSDASTYLGHGVMAMGHSRVFVTDTIASGSDGAGFFAGATSGELQADHCQSFGNRDGFLALQAEYGAGLMMVSNSAAENNSRYGFAQIGTSSAFYSEGNNTVRRNSTNTSGTITVVAPT